MEPPTFVVKFASLSPDSANVISSSSGSSAIESESSECAKPMSTSSPMDAMNGGSVDAGSGLKCRVGVSAKESSTPLARPSSTLRKFRRKRQASTDVTLEHGMCVQHGSQGRGGHLSTYGSMNTETRLDVRRIWFAPVSVRMVCRMLRIANGLKSALCQCASSSSATREEGSHIVDNTYEQNALVSA